MNCVLKSIAIGVITLLTMASSAPYFATCVGADPCNACKNCRYCGHCAKRGGTCGVCKRR